jgi:hypothetical protein
LFFKGGLAITTGGTIGVGCLKAGMSAFEVDGANGKGIALLIDMPSITGSGTGLTDTSIGCTLVLFSKL